jgi:hypothetical protein
LVSVNYDRIYFQEIKVDKLKVEESLINMVVIEDAIVIKWGIYLLEPIIL